MTPLIPDAQFLHASLLRALVRRLVFGQLVACLTAKVRDALV